MGIMGMANNPAMVQAFFQQQQMQMMQQQQQAWQQMQIQLASAYQHQQQNYNAPHQQSHSPHHRLPPHTKQHRQYAGRGGGYHHGGMGMGVGLAPPVQPQQQFSNARGSMATHDVPPAPKSVAGTAADGMSAQLPLEGQATTNEGNMPTSDGGTAPLAVTAPHAVPAVAAPQQLEQSAPAPAVVAAQHPLAASVPENTGEASAAASKESVKASESSDAESNAAAASNVASNAKQDAAPKSWAQMASKPPQNKPAPPAPVAVSAAHSEGTGVAVTAAEGGKDADRREAGADTGEQRPPGPRREPGRNEGPRKDSAPGGDRGGGKGKGNSVGGAGRGDGGGRPGGQQAGRGMRTGNAH